LTTPARWTTGLVLIGVLFGSASSVAQATPVRHSAAYGAVSASYGAAAAPRTGVGKGSGGKRRGGYRSSHGGGYSYRGSHGSSYSRHGKMPLWQAFLVLFLFGGLAVWGIVTFVRRLRDLLKSASA